MGDNLAQDLYAAFRANVDPEQPSWVNLPSLEREAWEVVATKARNVMTGRFVADILDVRSAYEQPETRAETGAKVACGALLSRWSR